MANSGLKLQVPTPEALAIEISYLSKRLKIADSSTSRKAKEEAALLFVEIASRKDYFKMGSGFTYEPPNEIHTIQRMAVLKLFKVLNGCNWNRVGGWIGLPKTNARPQIKPLEVESCLFDGILVAKASAAFARHSTTSTYNVAGINMNNNNCEGDFPACITEFKLCQSLKLNHNLLSSTLPRNLSQLTNLNYLTMSSNNLEGKLSQDVFNSYEKLYELDLSYNYFEGNIPDAFENKANSLEWIDLSCNQLIGDIPSSISCLKKLTSLKIFKNQLTYNLDSFPMLFQGCMHCLVEVNLSFNRLSGSINTFMNCTQLKRLVLNNNQISGEIPASISQLKHLNVLYLQYNCISGCIPMELCKLHTSLSLLNMSNNQLVGVIPEKIGDLVDLETLILHGNNINGPAPLSLSKLKNLKDFSCFNSFPSENFKQKRRFNRHEFERIFVVGPKLKLDNVHWMTEVLYGDMPNAAGVPGKFVSAIQPISFDSAYRYDMYKQVKGLNVEAYGNYKPSFRLNTLSAARKERYSLNG